MRYRVPHLCPHGQGLQSWKCSSLRPVADLRLPVPHASGCLMAATHLTLEEAAERLGISPEEFKKRLKPDPAFKILVPIRDGSSLRFKSGAIDELARQLGAASDPELPLGPMEDSVPPDS